MTARQMTLACTVPETLLYPTALGRALFCRLLLASVPTFTYSLDGGCSPQLPSGGRIACFVQDSRHSRQRHNSMRFHRFLHNLTNFGVSGRRLKHSGLGRRFGVHVGEVFRVA